MRSLVLNVDDTVYDKLVNFLKILPENKVRIMEEIKCSKQLKEELLERRKEIAQGDTLTHDELWGSTGL
ncbi:MAG: hypothetical protein PVH61_37970 [Candidatus Aminicenantes bacterium]|jgi:hypothetical protein